MSLMNLKNLSFKPHGLRARFGLSLLKYVILCIFVFFILYNVADYTVMRICEQPGFKERQIQRLGQSLQRFIDENKVSSLNLSELKTWERKHPVMFLQLYYEDKHIYSSFYEPSEDESLYDISYNIIDIHIDDKNVKCLICCDFTYRYYIWGTAIVAAGSISLFIFLFLRDSRKLINYICRLNDEVQVLEGGNLEYEVSVEGNDEITELARSMNGMRESFLRQMETERWLYMANRQLITQMSHDLRTPLTGIMLYLEIIKSHRYMNQEELSRYIDIIGVKTEQMKAISDRLFEYSLENNRKTDLDVILPEEAFHQVLESIKNELSAQGFRVELKYEWPGSPIFINKEYIWRIFDNITSNIIKYAKVSSEIVVNTVDQEKYFGFTVQNERILIANGAESNKIGIESVHAMMNQMNGNCFVEQTETTFEILLLFKKIDGKYQF